MRRFGILFVLALATAGCRSEPPVVISDMPYDTIVGRPNAGLDAPPRRADRQTPFPVKAWAPEAAERPWEYIVIHHSASENGSADSFNRMHRAKGWDELGYHFVITNGRGGTDGAVEVGGRWKKQKWGSHAGGSPDNEYNNFGIGICLVGDFTNTHPTGRQLESLWQLVNLLMDRYDIPPARVIGHRDVPGAKTACPGDRLERYLNDSLRPALAKKRKE